MKNMKLSKVVYIHSNHDIMIQTQNRLNILLEYSLNTKSTLNYNFDKHHIYLYVIQLMILGLKADESEKLMLPPKTLNWLN